MSRSELNPYEALANAVVLQAVKDYRDARMKLKRGRRNTEADTMKTECERFFLSSYFQLFTELDGKLLIRKLEQEVNAE